MTTLLTLLIDSPGTLPAADIGLSKVRGLAVVEGSVVLLFYFEPAWKKYNISSRPLVHVINRKICYCNLMII